MTKKDLETEFLKLLDERPKDEQIQILKEMLFEAYDSMEDSGERFEILQELGIKAVGMVHNACDQWEKAIKKQSKSANHNNREARKRWDWGQKTYEKLKVTRPRSVAINTAGKKMAAHFGIKEPSRSALYDHFK